jgi:4-amino-4-deoxy-L-arabinose transferase-like glycosyltransferase
VLCAVYVLTAIREGNLRGRGIYWKFGLLGLTSGLALASKHNSALVIVPVYLSIFILLWFAGRGLEQKQKTTLHFRLLLCWLGSGLLGFFIS